MKKTLLIISICAVMLSACSLNGSENRNAASGKTTESTAAVTGSQANTAGSASNASEQPTTGTEAIAAKVSDYFPFTVDTHMAYKGTGNEYASYDTYVDYIRGDKMQIRKNNGGTEAAIVYAVKDGKLACTFSRGETYYKYDYTSSTDGEDVLLMEPLVAGTAWTAKDGSERSITSVDSHIETPSGNYTAIEVTTKGKSSTTKDYYTRNVGLVKTVFSSADGSGTVTSELEKVEKDVPYVRSMNFYFPQFEKDRIVFIKRDVSIKTNEDMKYKFQKELKTIPATGGLAKTLTKNTQVLGIKLDEAKNTVTVDLSSDFIKEMNAGTSFEGMLINSIVSTFGDYYLKDKVIITIDGKPYESGHILMKPGEAFDVKIDGITEFK